ncbi:unnamed protein product [Effrenium voratum]|uniref:Uncharacterized protein n=1 Tax=Effrenium voratum TaxID=2562239 RepID=A0AA36IZM6_9DINO|nr:unnamed protein product [Effrenium voratum]CAJ1412734.1 unnamed protein product [Effrenium voratum]
MCQVVVVCKLHSFRPGNVPTETAMCSIVFTRVTTRQTSTLDPCCSATREASSHVLQDAQQHIRQQLVGDWQNLLACSADLSWLGLRAYAPSPGCLQTNVAFGQEMM